MPTPLSSSLSIDVGLPHTTQAQTANTAVPTQAFAGLLSQLDQSPVVQIELPQALADSLTGKVLPQDWAEQLQALVDQAKSADQLTNKIVGWVEALPATDLEAAVLAKANPQTLTTIEPQVGSNEVNKMTPSVIESDSKEQPDEILAASPAVQPMTPSSVTQPGISANTTAAIQTAVADFVKTKLEPQAMQKQSTSAQSELNRPTQQATPGTNATEPKPVLPMPAVQTTPMLNLQQLRNALNNAATQLNDKASDFGLPSLAGDKSTASMPVLTARPVTEPRAPADPAPNWSAEGKIDAQLRSLTGRLEGVLTAKSDVPQTQQAPLEFSDSQWLKKLGERAEMLVKEGRTEMRVRLDPSHLGHIDLRLSQQGDSTQVQIVATEARVRDALESGQQRLRDQLAQAGVELSQFDVSDQRREQSHSGSSQAQAQNVSGSADDKDLDEGPISASKTPSNHLVDQRV